jgi:hypothetical protein
LLILPALLFMAALFVRNLRRDAHQTLAAIRAHLAPLCIATATLAAAGVLAIVALHSLAD